MAGSGGKSMGAYDYLIKLMLIGDRSEISTVLLEFVVCICILMCTSDSITYIGA
jgi:hypothetical protein